MLIHFITTNQKAPTNQMKRALSDSLQTIHNKGIESLSEMQGAHFQSEQIFICTYNIEN